MTTTIHGEVAWDSGFAVGLGRDYSEGATISEFLAEPIVVESFVADQCADFYSVEERWDADAVMPLPRQQHKAGEIAEAIDQSEPPRERPMA